MIKQRAKDPGYKQWSDFEEAVKLIRVNAETFNAAESDIVRDARKLEVQKSQKLRHDLAKLILVRHSFTRDSGRRSQSSGTPHHLRRVGLRFDCPTLEQRNKTQHHRHHPRSNSTLATSRRTMQHPRELRRRPSRLQMVYGILHRRNVRHPRQQPQRRLHHPPSLPHKSRHEAAR